MKERFVTTFLAVTICVALLLDRGISTSVSSRRRLTMDDLIASHSIQENATQSSLSSVEEEATTETAENNGTMLHDHEVGTTVTTEPSQNASNITNETKISPTQAPSLALHSMHPTTYSSSITNDDHVDATIMETMTNWMTPVTLVSDLPIVETSIELNNTSTELNNTSIELDMMPNSTNSNSTVTVMPTLALSVTPQLNETILEKAESTLNNDDVSIPDLALATFDATTSAPTSSSTSAPTVVPTRVNSPTMNPLANPTPLLETAVPSNLDNATTTKSVPPTSSTPTVEPTLNPSTTPTPPFVTAVSRSAPPTSTPTLVETVESPTFSPSVNAMQQSDAPTVSSLDNATLTTDLAVDAFDLTTSAPPTYTPTMVETVESPTFNPSANPMQQSDTPTASSLDNATLPDLVPAEFSWTVSAPPTSSPTMVETVESPTFNPSMNPTQLSDTPTASSLDNATLLDLVQADFAFNSTSAPPTSSPTIVEPVESPTFNPSSDFPTAYYPPTAFVYSPPITKEEVSTDDNTVSSSSSAPTQIPPTESPSSNSTSLAPSIEPTAQPTQNDDHDDETHNDKSAAITSSPTPTSRQTYPPTINTSPSPTPWPTYSPTINISPSPTPWPTYSPTTTEEANDAIYPMYYPTYQAEDEVADSPTYYPTYYPTTLRKGNRVRERRKQRLNAPPTESPTVVKTEFLEDVSASKTMAAVIGVILTIIGIGCCAWCV